ncbi:MAG TPA: 50S ribosome-binding protein YggL [Gemmatimonadaceae bacterium]|nr:50S ribosome-binding protein YggL [Gemmatimonadaceae bacterium]
MSGACPRYGFEVYLTPRAGIARDAFATLRANLLADVIEPNELTHTGGGEPAARYTLSRQGMQATEADRELVRRWADAHAAELSVEIGPLVDLDA